MTRFLPRVALMLLFCAIPAGADVELRLHLNEIPGATAFADASGKDRDASCTSGNCPTVVSDGFFGSGVRFDGTDDGIEVADNDVFSPSVNDFTVCVWFQVPVGASNPGNGGGGSTGGYIVAKGAASNWEWAIENDSDNRLVYIAWQISAVTHMSINTTMTLNDNRYHQACMKVDAGVQLDGYLNGKLVSSDSSPNGSMGNGTSPVYVGRRGDGNYYDGRVFEVSIWDSLLTPLQIREQYRFSSRRWLPPENLQWPFGFLAYESLR